VELAVVHLQTDNDVAQAGHAVNPFTTWPFAALERNKTPFRTVLSQFRTALVTLVRLPNQFLD
ncbi:hypothetical protein, partial [Schlesneria paludicola]|uniref:hypothetical protein n=1 Tax=Schlesneria paludicola TaxID=360056 RepID=UPI00029B1A55